MFAKFTKQVPVLELCSADLFACTQRLVLSLMVSFAVFFPAVQSIGLLCHPESVLRTQFLVIGVVLSCEKFLVLAAWSLR